MFVALVLGFILLIGLGGTGHFVVFIIMLQGFLKTLQPVLQTAPTGVTRPDWTGFWRIAGPAFACWFAATYFVFVWEPGNPLGY